jgi:DNA ligase-associated metallophosphoesterase
MEIEFHGETFILDPKKAFFWKEERWLILADVHWGKTHFFQKHGLPVGHQVLRKDLENLTNLIKKYQPELVLCLGDLIHHELVMKTSLIDEITQFRDELPIPFILIRGNHEAYIDSLPDAWGIEIVEDHYTRRKLTFTHEHEKNIEGPQIYGHLHPKLFLAAQGDQLSLPCFLRKKDQFILPAFSEFCGGKNIELKKNQTAYLCADTKVISFP